MSSNTAASIVALSLVLLAAPASAEPVMITTGSLEPQLLSGGGRLLMEGSGFQLNVGLDGGSFRASLSLACTPCTPGTTLDLGGAFDFPVGEGTALVNGVHYSKIYVDGMTGTFTTPSFQIADPGMTTVTLPFVYTGTVRGYTLDPFVHGPTDPAFTQTLAGTGTATAKFFFDDSEGAIFTASTLRYDFGETAPVPEPGTLMLVSTAVGFVLLRARRRTSGQSGQSPRDEQPLR